ncbi:hypothetical protein PAHAL_9G440500 [Panicum hallii]|uniref:Uncharacterized protein n=1 Tax=Panicum hallii TaxID=206008 RepID=A0A2T8I4L2_9POAL|nr:hypothetical protein PAHAL_9G440500 [Panicum hallii]
MYTGNPRYFSVRASTLIPKTVISCCFSTFLAFLLNIIEDLSLFIICPEQSSYNERICCTRFALRSSVFRSSKESSANKR